MSSQGLVRVTTETNVFLERFCFYNEDIFRESKLEFVLLIIIGLTTELKILVTIHLKFMSFKVLESTEIDLYKLIPFLKRYTYNDTSHRD